MENQKEQIFQINNIDNVEHLNVLLNQCKQNFGEILQIKIYNIIDEKKVVIAEYRNEKDLSSNLNNEKYSKSTLIDLLFRPRHSKSVKLVIDKKNKTLTSKEIYLNNEIEFKEARSVSPNQTIEQAFSDKNAMYYKFNIGEGVIGKYDPTTKLYYRLDYGNNWIVDGIILSWLIGSEIQYEEINNEQNIKKK